MMFLVRVHLERPGVDHLFARRVSEAAVGHCNNADDDEKDSDNSSWFHDLERTPARDELNDQHDQSNHEQEVNESTQRVGADQTQEPEDEEDNEDSPKHIDSFYS